jgi:hypothetical protein
VLDIDTPLAATELGCGPLFVESLDDVLHMVAFIGVCGTYSWGQTPIFMSWYRNLSDSVVKKSGV